MTIADTEYDVIRKEVQLYTSDIANIIANGTTLGFSPTVVANCIVLREKQLVSSIMNRYRDKMIKNSTPCEN